MFCFHCFRSLLAPKFRQLTDGYHMIQLIYDAEDQLVDCEFGHNRNQTKLFLINLKRELHRIVSSNISVQSLEGASLPREFRWMNYSYLREICGQKHHEIKNEMHKKKVSFKVER